MCTAQIRDVIGQMTQQQPDRLQKDSILIAGRGPAGIPVGIGGERRNKKIMNLVDQAQGLKIQE